ncbi:hypothetical protein [Burkholderia sp. Nafp2/4-1b]|uniref:hypothetical protein n=1 Tax=Burkholderia sp. Nafp2/4-1b TaxID=2116686 RepID=UPI0013CEDD81|nr:hypothetical protein [Burkholderia sp. Nafp2/4-1b]
MNDSTLFASCGPLTIFYICCFLRRIIGVTLARRFPNVCFCRVVVGINQADGATLFNEIRHIPLQTDRPNFQKLTCVNTPRFESGYSGRLLSRMSDEKPKPIE